MPYAKTGFYKVPRSRYIPQFCADIMTAFGDTLDQDLADCIKSLGNEKVYLKNFFFTRTLFLKHARLNADDTLAMKMKVVLADLLHSIGYIETSPVQFDYRVDPVMTADELLDLMIGTRMPTFKATEFGGEYATIDTLMCLFPDVIRKNALIINERPMMAARFRTWLGNIGWKLMTNAGELSQTERSFLVIYGCTKKRSKGYIDRMATLPIPPVENKDVLVTEVGAIATACCLSGPCTNHFKLVSNGILEQLVFYYGPHVSELKSFIGFARTYGPFIEYDVTAEEAIPWMLESQITGITSNAANVTVRPQNQPPFTLRVPLPIAFKNATGAICLYPELPDFKLYLVNQKDIARFTWDYPSKWRGRRINSQLDGGTMDFAMCDAAVNSKAAGGMQVESADLSGAGLCWFGPGIADANKVIDSTTTLLERYILPSKDGLQVVEIDMSAYYSRFGTIELLPAFSEFLQLPLSWFVQPAERVVDYISSVQGLTIQERVRFAPIIAMSHNCARYERLTRRTAPIDQMRYVKTILNLR